MSGNGEIKIEIQGLDQVKRQIETISSRVKNLRPLLVDISEIIHAEVEDNFQAGGRDPKWKPSQRVKKHGGQTLINKAGLLSSIQTFVTDTTAGVATNKKYAAIHNFGGEIKRHPFSMSVRLRQNAKGSLLRQQTNKNLAVFAKSSHKRATVRRYTSSGWTVQMPQREFMKITPSGIEKIELAVTRFIALKAADS